MWRDLQACDNKGEAVKHLERRHVFQKASNAQLIQAMDERGEGAAEWERDLKAVVDARGRVACPTQVIEEVNGMVKNSKALKTVTRVRRPQKAMALVLQSNLFDKRHRWTNVETHAATGPKCQYMKASHFQAPKDKRSLPFKEVATPGPPKWYSPTGNNFCAHIADLNLLAAARDAGDFNKVETSWVADLFDVGHRLLVKVPRPEGPQWYHAWYRFDHSGALAWPVRLVTEGNMTYFEYEKGAAQPSLLPIMSLTDITGMCFRWRSWPWQLRHMPGNPARKPAIRGLCDGPEESLLKVAARAAFWGLSKSQVQRFGGLVGCDTPSSMSFPNVLHLVISKVLGLSGAGGNQSAADIISQRLADREQSCEFADTLIGADETYDVMSKPDVDKLQEERKACASLLHTKAIFKDEYMRWRSSVLPKVKKPISKKARYLLPSTIPQRKARKHIPDDCHIWRGVVRSEWCGHCRGHRRVQASWLKYGERNALIVVLRMLWDQHLTKHGKQRDQCPINDLWTLSLD